MTHTVWTYWEGPRPDYIDLCLKTMEAVWNVRVLTPEDTHEIGDVLNPSYRKIEIPAVRSGFIRVAVLARYGGWWVDADTVALKPLPRSRRNFSYINWKRGRACNAYLFATRKDPLVQEWLYLLNRLLVNYKEIRQWWGAPGEAMLTTLVLLHPTKRLAIRQFMPFDFSSDPEVFNREISQEEFYNRTKDAKCIALNNSWLCEHAQELISTRGSSRLLHRILELAEERVH